MIIDFAAHPWILPAALALCLLLGGLLGALVRQFKIQALKNELKHNQSLYKTQLDALEDAHQQVKDSFAALSQEALKENRDAFLSLAAQNIQQHQMSAKAEMDKREQSIQGLLNPMRETLSRTEQQLRVLEKDRASSHSSLQQQLHQLAQTQTVLQSETRNLVTALRRPEVRGQWGEITLKRLAELAGMVEYCDFYEQNTVRDKETGQDQRPDMVVRMPDERELVIDAKTPLDAYLRAAQAETDEERRTELQNHARILRGHVRTLAQKKYWNQFKKAPDYVVLFIPGEQFLSAALEVDNDLMEYALSHQVILASPTSLIALLRAVAFGWRQQAVTENAEKIQQLGEELYQRISTFSEHMTRMGNSLDKSVDYYNKAVGSLERNVLSGARKFVELGIEDKKALQEPEPIEKQARNLQAKD